MGFREWLGLDSPATLSPVPSVPANIHRVHNVARSVSVPEAGSTRRPRGAAWNVAPVTASTVTATRATIVRRARGAAMNDSLAAAALDKLCAAIVGTGIVPRSASPDERTRKAADALFLAWTDEASTDPGLSDWYAVERAAVYGWLRDGESWIRLRPRKPEDGLRVPLQVSLHDSEAVTDRSDGDRIIQGLELSPTGQVQAYMFRDPKTGAERPVPAEACVHLFAPSMPGQVRGLPILTPVLPRLHDLDLFADATLKRTQLAAMFAGFIRGGDDLLVEDDDNAVALEAGTLQRLGPGEDITFPATPDAAGFAEFWRAQVDAISGALMGMPPWYLLGQTAGLETDRTMRVQLLAFRRQILAAQHQVVAPALRQVWLAWFAAAVKAGALVLPAGAKVEDHAAVVFRAPRNEHLHPVQDVAALRDAVRAGMRSLSSIIAENGDDPDATFAEIAADQKALDRLGLVVESDARQKSAKAGA